MSTKVDADTTDRHASRKAVLTAMDYVRPYIDARALSECGTWAASSTRLFDSACRDAARLSAKPDAPIFMEDETPVVRHYKDACKNRGFPLISYELMSQTHSRCWRDVLLKCVLAAPGLRLNDGGLRRIAKALKRLEDIAGPRPEVPPPMTKEGDEPSGSSTR